MKPLVIGASLGRTGTYSLKLALERLGYTPCLHMSDFAADAALSRLWLGELKKSQPDWEKLLQGYRAVVDWPACNYVDQLLQAFPLAKVVYIERSFSGWYRSLEQTILPALKWSKNIADQSRSPFIQLSHREVLGKTFNGQLGKKAAENVFRKHRDFVLDQTPPAQRLLFHIAEGWEPLCTFLDAPIPNAPFPKSNASVNFIDTLRRRKTE